MLSTPLPSASSWTGGRCLSLSNSKGGSGVYSLTASGKQYAQNASEALRSGPRINPF